MRGSIFTRSAVIAVAGAALLAGTAAAAIAEPGSASTQSHGHRMVTDQPSQVVELGARFSPAQLEQLAAAAPSPARGTSAPLPATGSGVGIMAQGGFDRDHWWFKISTAEVISIGVNVACRAAFPGVGWFVCPPISAAVNWALQQYPNAGGFWAEFYTNGHVRVGTW